MMPSKKELSLRTIQKIANTIDLMKNLAFPEKWDASTQYWMGRLRNFCEPIVNRITETRDNLVRAHGVKNDKGTYSIKDEEAFNLAVKALLDTQDTIRFPEFKASAFVKMKDKKVEESLVPIDFWEVFSDHIEMDVEAFQITDEENA